MEVTAYCADPVHAETVTAEALRRWPAFRDAAGLAGELTCRQETIHEEDWAEGWKAYYHPLRVGRRLVIKPSWQSWPPAEDPGAATPEDLIIELDPQMAFGTGTHATTQLCLEALERYVTPGAIVADIGAGSGILSIAAALLGAGSVVAWELDPVGVQVARANCAHNGVAARCTVHAGDALAALEGQFNLIVANVHTQFLLQLVPRLAEHLRPGGQAILSGTTETSLPGLTAALAQAGLALVEQHTREEWAVAVARSTGVSPVSD